MSILEEFNTLVYSLWNQGIGWLQGRGFENPELILVAALAGVLILLLLAVSGFHSLSQPRRTSRVKYDMARIKRNAPYWK